MLTRQGNKRRRRIIESDSEEDIAQDALLLDVDDEVLNEFITWEPIMCSDQTNRLQRMAAEPLYLIAIEDAGKKYKVSGKTGNLYTVKVDAKSTAYQKVASCTCPDAWSHGAILHSMVQTLFPTEKGWKLIHIIFSKI